MQILFDLQKEFEALEVGDFGGVGYILPSGARIPLLRVELVDDVKTLLVSGRESKLSGIAISLDSIPSLQSGDRLTVTGRVVTDVLTRNWGIGLFLDGNEDIQLDHQIVPRSLYALTCILEESHLKSNFTVQTTRWGASNPLMDFYVDSILVSRKAKAPGMETDDRTTVYSLESDPSIQWMDIDKSAHAFDNSTFLVRAGEPTVNIFRRGGYNALHIGNRIRDFDGVDIYFAPMKLVTGNQYEIVVTGRIDGDAPEGARIMIQGLPGYIWGYRAPALNDQEFTLTHTLSKSEMDKWTAVRVTSNAIGANMSFYIYSIEVKRLGLI